MNIKKFFPLSLVCLLALSLVFVSCEINLYDAFHIDVGGIDVGGVDVGGVEAGGIEVDGVDIGDIDTGSIGDLPDNIGDLPDNIGEILGEPNPPASEA